MIYLYREPHAFELEATSETAQTAFCRTSLLSPKSGNHKSSGKGWPSVAKEVDDAGINKAAAVFM